LKVDVVTTKQAAVFKDASGRTHADLIRMPTQFRLGKDLPNRKNSLFYKTLNGARVGDLFMSLIHTCELNRANPFDYVTELLRHAEELKRSPSEWMPWNYRKTLFRLATPTAA
jgi:hypothetical protein